MAETRTVVLLGNVVKETAKALLFEVQGPMGERAEWFPKSQVALVDLAFEGGDAAPALEAPAWLVMSKGLKAAAGWNVDPARLTYR